MAPFDYTTPQDVFAYGGSSGTATDPVNELALMAQLVTGMSRALDQYCNQVFSQETYVEKVLRALVDADGVLTCYPPVPEVASITAAAWRAAGAAIWQSIEAGAFDVEANSFGCVARLLGRSFRGERGSRIQVRLSFTGGWANLAAVPADFAWNTRRLCWWAFQKRSAPMERTAIPELGVLVIPSSWPKDLREAFGHYVRQVPL